MGRHVPSPAASFKDLPVAQDLLENITGCGYSEPTPIQMQAMPIMLEVCTHFLRYSYINYR